jgi:hypothetical protein
MKPVLDPKRLTEFLKEYYKEDHPWTIEEEEAFQKWVVMLKEAGFEIDDMGSV